MADSNFKIIYFNIPGRAEVSRLILVLAGKDFDDCRVSREQWLEIKPTTPFGTCPVLVIDGEMYSQSKAIATYLAKVFGFYGKTNIDGLKIDQVMYLMEDFFQEFGKLYFFETDEVKKAEGAKKLKEETSPRFLGFYEKMLKDNSNGYLVGDMLSMADIAIFDMFTGFMRPFVECCIEKYPLVKQLVDTVGSNERITAYMAKRK